MIRTSFCGFDNSIIAECMENLLPYIAQYGKYISDFSVFKHNPKVDNYIIECIINDQDYFTKFQSDIESSQNWEIEYESKGGGMCEYVYAPDDDDLQGKITLEIILEI